MSTLGYISQPNADDEVKLTELTIASGSEVITSTLDSTGMTFTTGDITMTAGDVTLTAGDVVLTAGDLFLPASGGTVTALNHYEEYSDAAVTWEGALSAGSTGNAYRITRIGNLVHFSAEEVLFTADTLATISLAAADATPARFRPTNAKHFVIRVRDNGADVFGLATVSTAGDVTVGINADGDIFTGGGNTGLYAFDITWNVDN